MSDQADRAFQSAKGAPSTEPDQPMPDQGPAIDELGDDRTSGPRPEGDQVTLGLERKADDPETAEPLVHPQGLVGERPATASVERPG